MRNLFATWPALLARELHIPVAEAKRLWDEPTPGVAKSALPWVVIVVCVSLSLILRGWEPSWLNDELRRFLANSLFIGGSVFGTQLFLRAKLRLIVQRHAASPDKELRADRQAPE
ncbi:hypothetical protein [Herbaspirillum sp. ST 5-3]|uniref:hypothetical protein n=1 Tax=Oxalobacteraceae TaxID=75682 RepID=UPI0010A42C1A|nr:hypothetical protein [Herbaspirillum sp. ST 5-3]